jgi:hypothetical protein
MEPALLLPLSTRVRHRIAPAKLCVREPLDRWVERAGSSLALTEKKKHFALSSPVGFAEGFYLDIHGHYIVNIQAATPFHQYYAPDEK